MVALGNKIILFMKLAVHALFEMMVFSYNSFLAGFFFDFPSSSFLSRGRKWLIIVLCKNQPT